MFHDHQAGGISKAQMWNTLSSCNPSTYIMYRNRLITPSGVISLRHLSANLTFRLAPYTYTEDIPTYLLQLEDNTGLSRGKTMYG